MKQKTIVKFALIFLIITLLSNFASSKDQTISVTYDFLNNTKYEATIDFSSFLLKINTEKDAFCKYSINKGLPFENMEGNFDVSYNKVHEKSFLNKEDGIYRYYIKCVEDPSNITIEPSELEVVIRIDSLISGQIVLSENSPLKAGRYEVTLVLSKPATQTPSLLYSFDNIVYNPIILAGSEKLWKGYLIIPDDLGEKTLSFKFSATDLRGRVGSEITSGSIYIVDTIKPKMISDIKATGYEGEIKLEWRYEDNDAKKFNIYRSTEPNPDYTDFYKTTTSNPYHDNLVEKGKTYYYRISVVDEAGNEGELSKEVHATALIENITSPTSGLALELRGYVDNLLAEIELIINETKNIKNIMKTKEGKENALFKELKLEQEIDRAVSELNSLKRDVSNYKNQDLTKDELDNKLNSARVKLGIIKRKIPENIIITQEESVNKGINEKDVEEALLEIKEDITEKQKEKSVEKSLEMAEEFNLTIKSDFYNLEILYLDGTRKEVSVIRREIQSQLEKQENCSFIEIIPKDIAETVSDIDIKNLNYEIIKTDPIISFTTDTKKIIYVINKKINLGLLKDAKLTLVKIYTPQTSNSKITGYFVSGLNQLKRKEYLGFVIGIIIIIALTIYFIKIKKRKKKEKIKELKKEIEKFLDLISKKESKNALKTYKKIKEIYKELDKKQKKDAYEEIGYLIKYIKKKNENPN